MRGIILAGGTGSRLGLNCSVTNKHLLSVYNKPMILWALETLTNMGINDILIVVGGNSVGEILNLIKDGSEFKCNVTYKYQKGANGIADALRIAEDFVGRNKFCTILGDNIFLDIYKEIQTYALKFDNDPFCNAMCVLKEVTDASRFGVAEFKENKIIGIEEKPKIPKSDFAITGLYFLTPNIFAQIKTLKPSARGEYEITDVLRINMEINSLKYDIFSGIWTDAGNPDSLLRASFLAQHYIENYQ